MAHAIGTKKTVGKHNGPKRFTNGHKQFDSVQSMELGQVLRTEERIMQNFERNKLNLTRSRNPLAGEVTPRENEGVKILPAIATEPYVRPQKQLTGKIGAHADAPMEVKVASPIKDADRIKVLQFLHDDVTGELEFWKMKLATRERQMQNCILKNRLKGV